MGTHLWRALPLSSDYTNPGNGEILVVAEGDKNTGINEYNFNFQNNYSFSQGMLKGLGVFTGVRTYYKNRAYYTSYFPPGAGTNPLRAQRMLYRLPTSTVFDLGLSYRFKLPGRLERFSFTTQLNINNALNHYKVWVLPSNTNGAVLNARLSAMPRQFIWTNTIGF